jgi:hypothetical protein
MACHERKLEPVLLVGDARRTAEEKIRNWHYARTIPSGRSHWIGFGTAIIVFSQPANYRAAGHFMPGTADPAVLELTRLWAPDGHPRNLLTMAISRAVGLLKQAVPDIDLVVAYADPAAGHHGGIYKAASWISAGRSEEPRAWRRADGTGPIVPRRAFHVGPRHLNKPAIEALGYVQLRLAGKHRFVRPLSRRAKRLWATPPPASPRSAAARP